MTDTKQTEESPHASPVPRGRARTKRTLMGEGYQIYNRSCVKMPQIDADSVALVLADPPYFLDGMDERWDNAKLQRRVKGGVVSSLPAGQRFDPAQGVRLQRFMSRVGRECYRVLKPGGFMLCFGQPRLIHRTANALERVGFEIRDLIAWRYEGQAKAFSQDHFVRKMDLPEAEKEAIIAKLGGRKTPQLKPRMELVVVAQKQREGTFVDNWLKYRAGLIDVRHPLIDSRHFPANVVDCAKPRTKYGHMTVKPVDLCRHLIRIFSAKSDTVLDPFIGTGTTAVAALAEARACIGYELDTAMMGVIASRLNEYLAR